MEKILKQEDKLKALCDMSPEAHQVELRHCDREVIRCIVELFTNLLTGNIKMPEAQRKKLKAYRDHIYRIHKCVNCKTNKVNIAKARRVLVNQKGGLLPFVVPSLLEILGKAILTKALSQ